MTTMVVLAVQVHNVCEWRLFALAELPVMIPSGVAVDVVVALKQQWWEYLVWLH